MRPRIRWVFNSQRYLRSCAVGERAVAGERLLARGVTVEHGRQLAAAGEAEIQGRADALGGQRQAVPGGVAREEDPVLDRRSQLMGNPVALIPSGREAQVAASLTVGSLTWFAGQNEPAPTRSSSRAGKAPAVPGPHIAWGRSTAASAHRRRREGAPRGHVRGGPWAAGSVLALDSDAPPAERVHDQRRGQVAAVCVHGVAVAAADRGRLELDVPSCACGPQQRAQLAVVERGQRPWQRPARLPKGVCTVELVEGLTQVSRTRSSASSQGVGMPQAEVWRSPIS